MPISPLPKVSSRYGAPMGRHGSWAQPDEQDKFYLVRVRLNSGGYDSGGAYWGHSLPLYRFETTDRQSDGYLRARSRNDAKTILRNEFGETIRFFR